MPARGPCIPSERWGLIVIPFSRTESMPFEHAVTALALVECTFFSIYASAKCHYRSMWGYDVEFSELFFM